LASTTNHYDLIVLGPDIAGLVAAALVARRGKRVLVMPHGGVDGAYRLGSRVLPLTTAPVVHMGTPPVRRVFQELGLLQQVRRQHKTVEGFVHIALPGQRLDLQPGGSNRAKELRREWPDDPVLEAFEHQQRWRDAVTDVLDQLLSSDNALVADGFWSRRFLARVAAQLPGRETDEFAPLAAGHPARDAARAFEPWLQHLNPAQLGKAASLRLCGLWNPSPEDLPRGLIRVRELLLQRIALHSGEVKPDLRVGEILLKRGRVVGVTLLGKPDRYGCDHMIVATDPGRLVDGLLAADQLPKALSANLAAVKRCADRYVMHLEIAEAGLSPGLDGIVMCLPEISANDPQAQQKTSLGVGRMFVRQAPGVTEGTRRISVERIVSATEPRTTLRERTLSELDERGILPFCHNHLVWVHSPHDGRPATNGRGEPLADLRSMTPMAQPMESIIELRGHEPTLGIGVFPHASGLKSLYLASRLTLPGLGLEGEFSAGTVAAGLVAPPARSPFARSPLLSRA